MLLTLSAISDASLGFSLLISLILRQLLVSFPSHLSKFPWTRITSQLLLFHYPVFPYSDTTDAGRRHYIQDASNNFPLTLAPELQEQSLLQRVHACREHDMFATV